MKFYLSSFKIGNEGKKLKGLVKNKKIGYIPNGMDFSEATLENREKLISYNLNNLRQLELEPEVLNLRNYFGKPNELAKKLDELKAVWISGGNVFVLRQAMKLSGFDRYVQTHLDKNFVYAGYSAAICVLCENLKPLKIVDKSEDFPYQEIQKTIWKGLGILTYTLLPHYKSDHPETEVISKAVQYCIENNIPYKTLKDGEVLILE